MSCVIREEELDVRTVDGLGADNVNFLRVAGFNDPEVVLVHVLVGGIGAHLQKTILGETGVEEGGYTSAMSGLVVSCGPSEEDSVVKTPRPARG